MEKTVAFVPIRSGSQEIKNKNINKMYGKPLCFWALEALQKSYINKIVVATDSKKYKEIISGFQFDKINFYDRDYKNAQDNSTTEDVLLEYFGEKGHDDNYENFILCQVTNPLITYKDVNGLINHYLKNGYNSMLTVADLEGRFLWSEESYQDTAYSVNYDYRQRPLRQWGSYEHLYMENGAMYINSILNLLKGKNRLTEPIGLYVMSSYSLHEVDSKIDWLFVEKILEICKNGGADYFK